MSGRGWHKPPPWSVVVGHEPPDSKSPYGYEVLADGRRLPLAPRRHETMRSSKLVGMSQNDVDDLVLEATKFARKIAAQESSNASTVRLAAAIYCYALSACTGVTFQDVEGIINVIYKDKERRARKYKSSKPEKRQRKKGPSVTIPGGDAA